MIRNRTQLAEFAQRSDVLLCGSAFWPGGVPRNSRIVQQRERLRKVLAATVRPENVTYTKKGVTHAFADTTGTLGLGAGSPRAGRNRRRVCGRERVGCLRCGGA